MKSLFSILSSVFITGLLINCLSVYTILNIYEKGLIKYNSDINININRILNYEIEKRTKFLTNIIKHISSHNILINSIEDKNNINLYKFCNNKLKLLTNLNIDHLYIFDTNKNYIFNSNNFKLKNTYNNNVSLSNCLKTNKIVSGCELDSSGCYALRVIYPIFSSSSINTVIGYIELNQNFKHITKHISNLLYKNELTSIIDKSYINRFNIIELKTTPLNWLLFKNFVINFTTLPESDIINLEDIYNTKYKTSFSLSFNNDKHFIYSKIKLKDINDNNVCTYIVTTDITESITFLVQLLKYTISINISLLLFLLIILYIYLKYITTKEKLGNILLKQKYINENQLQIALDIQNGI